MMNTRMSKGFTLIELLTVLAVMIIVTSIVVTSSFGLTKGAAYTTAQDIPFNVLSYARQRACMDGKTTIARFFDDGGEKTLSIFQASGVVTSTSKNGIVDRYTGISSMGETQAGGMLVALNFESGATFVVETIKKNDDAGFITLNSDDAADGKKNKYIFPVREINATSESDFSSGKWKAGSTYGFEISERVRLPKDFNYSIDGGEKSGDAFWVTFLPDGSSKDATITIEAAQGGSNSRKIEIVVRGGQISVDKGF